MRLHKGPRRPRFESNVCTTLPCRGRAKDVLLLPKAVRGGVAAVPHATPMPGLWRGCHPLPAPLRGPTSPPGEGETAAPRATLYAFVPHFTVPPPMPWIAPFPSTTPRGPAEAPVPPPALG